MSSITKRNALMVVVSCLAMLFFFVGCDSNREYYDDIHIQLETDEAEIVIKEWRFLLGSGAEVYYKSGEKEVLLGELLGGDDGFCPFKEGLYSVTVEDSKLIVEWCRFPTNQERPWEKKIFDFPSN
jgi:hypothetical protein